MLQSVQILLKITHLASRKSLLRITRLAHRKLYLVIMCRNKIIYPNPHEKLIKLKLGQAGVNLNIAQNHQFSPKLVISGHYLPKSQEKLTRSKIRPSWSRFEHCSESLVWPKGSHIWSSCVVTKLTISEIRSLCAPMWIFIYS